LEKVVAPNDFVKRSLMNIGVFQEKIAVISSTIDKEAFRRTFSNSLLDDFREELCYSSSDFIITYLGSPCTLRGTDTIIKSVKKVSEKTHKIRAILLCRGNRKEELFLSHLDEKEYLSRLIDKLEIKPYVRLVTGILGKGQLSKYLSISDAIVLPFKTLIAENPLAPLEAMSLGKLVIVTKVGSLSELVGGNKGISIRANDANELSKVILYAINHPERSKELANNARNFAANLPDWEEVAQTTLTLLARAHASFETKLCKHRGVK
jgi:glycosyltransferase involved in cell wall biosynthesis